MKKVYLVTVDQAYKGDILGNGYPRAFDSLEKAKAEFKRFVDDDKEYCNRDQWNIETDTDIDFEAYEEGCYTMNHTEAHILKLDVE